MAPKPGSSGRWLRRQERDPYVEQAAREGWRSRAVFKLRQIQEKEKILRPGMRCLDLGASPGGWSQFAVQIVGPRGHVWALDLLPMEPIAGVACIQGDFNDAVTLNALREALGAEKLDLVMSDLAPNISGNRAVDQPRSMQLAEDALALAGEVLRAGGDFLVKVFQGEGSDEFARHLRTRFLKVRALKPRASRPESREIYLLARNYRM
jgi:23S rRNA (uridine2552-2'-O)-methyltransferase